MLKLNGSSLALGAALAVGVMLVMSQAGPSQPQYVSWGPPKAGIVNIFMSPVPLVPSSGLVVYQVPSDRWLTLTHVSAEIGDCDPKLRIVEVLGGNTTDKGFASHTAVTGGGLEVAEVGWVFRPGSQVVVINPSSAVCTPTWLSVIGYQTRD